jgi:hypothetical protein
MHVFLLEEKLSIINWTLINRISISSDTPHAHARPEHDDPLIPSPSCWSGALRAGTGLDQLASACTCAVPADPRTLHHHADARVPKGTIIADDGS